MSTWAVILPVKHAPAAKSRLTGIPADLRIDLAHAFFVDVLEAVLHTPGVDQVIIVGDADTTIQHSYTDTIRFDTTPDPGAGLNAALIHASTMLDPGTFTLALMTDLPAITPTEIEAALKAAEKVPRSLVCDAEGTGTTALMSHDPTALAPHFGVRSRAAHVQSGAVDLQLSGLARMRRDVDTEIGLWDAERLGVGAHTREVLARSRRGLWRGATCVAWSPAHQRQIVLDTGRVLNVPAEASVEGFMTLRVGQRVEVDLNPTGDRVQAVRWPQITPITPSDR